MSHRATPYLLIGLLCVLVAVVVFDSKVEWAVTQTRLGEQKREVVERVIEALHTQQTALRRFRMRIESKEYSFDEEQEDFQEQETRVIDMRRLNEKIDKLTTRSQNGKMVQRLHHIRTDARLLSWQQDLWGPGSPPHAAIREAGTVDTLLREDAGIGRLYGYLGGDLVSLAEILKEADRLSLGERMERVNGFDCYRIEANTEYGEYQIWVDPGRGYGIRQVRVHKGPGDLLYDFRIEPKGSGSAGMPTEFELTVKDVRLQPFGATYIPTHEVITSSQERHDGLRRTRRSIIRRFDVDLDPRFAADAFTMTEIPDGTPLSNFDETDHGYGYEWQHRQAQQLPRPVCLVRLLGLLVCPMH